MLEWWIGLDWKIRLVVALLLLGISTVLYFAGIIWPWGWVVGGVLLLLCWPSESEKKGYRW